MGLLGHHIEVVEPEPGLPSPVSVGAADQIQGQLTARLVGHVLAQFSQGHVGLRTLGLDFYLTRGLKINPILHF
jgi:hypothetical protein